MVGVAWLVFGLTIDDPTRLLGVSLFVIVGILFLASAITVFTYTRWLRLRLWKQLAGELGATAGLRCVDLGSRDAIATSVLVSAVPDVHATVIVTSPRTEKLVLGNVQAMGADDAVTVTTAQLWDLPLNDNCADVIVSDSAEQMVKQRAELSRTIDEIARIAAPSARLALVVGGRSRKIRDALVAAGAADARISRVPGSVGTGYRLVTASFPGQQ